MLQGAEEWRSVLVVLVVRLEVANEGWVWRLGQTGEFISCTVSE